MCKNVESITNPTISVRIEQERLESNLLLLTVFNTAKHACFIPLWVARDYFIAVDKVWTNDDCRSDLFDLMHQIHKVRAEIPKIAPNQGVQINSHVIKVSDNYRLGYIEHLPNIMILSVNPNNGSKAHVIIPASLSEDEEALDSIVDVMIKIENEARDAIGEVEKRINGHTLNVTRIAPTVLQLNIFQTENRIGVFYINDNDWKDENFLKRILSSVMDRIKDGDVAGDGKEDNHA